MEGTSRIRISIFSLEFCRSNLRRKGLETKRWFPLFFRPFVVRPYLSIGGSTIYPASREKCQYLQNDSESISLAFQKISRKMC